MDEMSINWTLGGVYLGAPLRRLFICVGARLMKSLLTKS